jgi:glycosyltransferase involved in cell wall biosynthesis
LQSCHTSPAGRGCNGAIDNRHGARVNPSLAYVLHSGQMFGTERMALATLDGLRRLPGLTCRPEGLVIAPPGPVHAAAAVLGLRSEVVPGRLAVVVALWRQLRRHPASVLLTTGVWQALAGRALQALLGGTGAHLHVVHGGTDERLSYGRKRLLAGLRVQLVAVSEFVRQRLQAHGVPASRVAVVGNFLPAHDGAARAAFRHDGVRRVAVLSRLDRIKRVGLLLDALDRLPALAALRFDVYGTGEEAAALAERARRHPNVTLHGYVPDAAAHLAQADLLLHTCPEEPFGLVLLEAFAAGVPVLVPGSGGAAEIVHDGVNGWHFSANDPQALGQQLLRLARAPAAQLNAVVAGGRQALASRHAPQRQAQRYAQLAGWTTAPQGDAA